MPLDLSKIKEELTTIDTTAIEVSSDKKMCPEEGCNKTAGFRTPHLGTGPCFIHDNSYKVMGLYKGSGSFSSALKDMESASDLAEKIDVQIRVKQAIIQQLMEKADKCGDDVPIPLLNEIKKTSEAITRDIEKKEKLEILKKDKLSVKKEFALELISILQGILKHRIPDRVLLKDISGDFKKVIAGLDSKDKALP